MDYLNLAGSVGEDQENDPADIKNTATGLADIGIGRVDRAARTGVWDADFDGGVRSYQADNALDVDGVLLPGGPTQRSINASLGQTDDLRMRAPAAADQASEPMPLLRLAALPRRDRELGRKWRKW